MTADEVLEEFLLDPCCIDCPASDCINERRMAEEIVRLREQLKYAQALLNQLHDSERLQDEIDRLRKELEVAAEEQEMVRDAITVHGGRPTVELVRFSQSGIWVNPDIPIDEVAQQVFALLEPMIVQSYTKAAAAAAEQEVADEVR